MLSTKYMTANKEAIFAKQRALKAKSDRGEYTHGAVVMYTILVQRIKMDEININRNRALRNRQAHTLD